MFVQSNLKLLFAAWAVVILIGLMAIVFLRSKKRAYALAVLPLGLPSAMYIVSGMLARWIDPLLPFANSYQIRMILDLAAALVACLLIGLLSGGISEGKRSRTLFAVCGTAFVVVLSGMFIMNSFLQAVAIA